MRDLSEQEVGLIALAVLCVVLFFYILLSAGTVQSSGQCLRECPANITYSFYYNESYLAPKTSVTCVFNSTANTSSIPAGSNILCSFEAMVNVSGEILARTIAAKYINWSSNHFCTSDFDCRSGGCNGELCGGRGDDLISACVVVSSPLRLGYKCGCAGSKCAWFN